MVRQDGRAVVLDFGIAKQVAPELANTLEVGSTAVQTSTGAVVGTPAYLAPEQALGKAVDARTDQFALAVTAYEALTGRLPSSGRSFGELLPQIVRDDPALPSSLARVPVPLDAVLLRAMAKKPEDRFADVNAFADALVAAFVEPSTGPVTEEKVPRNRRACCAAKFPRVAIAAGAVLFASGVIAAASMMRHEPKPSAAPAAATASASPASIGGASLLLACPPASCVGGGSANGVARCRRRHARVHARAGHARWPRRAHARPGGAAGRCAAPSGFVSA